MKKTFFALLFVLPCLLNAQLQKTLEKTIELKMPTVVLKSKITGLDSLSGTRGSAVVWHPLQKKYYAAFAGNTTYPMAVFDAKGKRLSNDALATRQDIRGLWYNPKLKKICGNGFGEIGWFGYKLDSAGIPVECKVDLAGMNQPDKQSVGIFNEKKNQVDFLYGQKIYVYNADGMQEEDSTIRLYPGITKPENINKVDSGLYISLDYSYNILVHTGIPKAEFGILNVTEKQVELYNKKTGLLTQKLLLPIEIPVYDGFNFCYSNGMYWAFNQDTRTWTGYK